MLTHISGLLRETVSPLLMHFSYVSFALSRPLWWRHNDHGSVSNHQTHECLLNRLFRRRSKKTSKLRVTGLCVGNSPGLVNSPHKGSVMRKMFPIDDVIMDILSWMMGQWPSHSALSQPIYMVALSWLCCYGETHSYLDLDEPKAIP